MSEELQRMWNMLNAVCLDNGQTEMVFKDVLQFGLGCSLDSDLRKQVLDYLNATESTSLRN